mgnify:CR=1 FL=1
MAYQLANKNDFKQLVRVFDLDLLKPKIRAEFFVRLYSLFNIYPEINYEGYEFFIINKDSGIKFSAALTGFGPGYFAEDNSMITMEVIHNFNTFLFQEFNDLKSCRIEIEHDFGKSIFGFEKGNIFEMDINDENNQAGNIRRRCLY